MSFENDVFSVKYVFIVPVYFLDAKIVFYRPSFTDHLLRAIFQDSAFCGF